MKIDTAYNIRTVAGLRRFLAKLPGDMQILGTDMVMGIMPPLPKEDRHNASDALAFLEVCEREDSALTHK